jgi:hypothetical protein
VPDSGRQAVADEVNSLLAPFVMRHEVVWRSDRGATAAPADRS